MQLLLLLFFTSSLHAQVDSVTLVTQQIPTIISGQILNPVDSLILIEIVPNPLANKQVAQVPAKIDSLGFFKVKINLAQPIPALLVHKKVKTSIFIVPGDSLHIEADFASSKVLQTFQFKGTGKAHNLYLKTIDYAFQKNRENYHAVATIKAKAPMQYKAYADSIHQSRLKAFEKYHQYSPVDSSFEAYILNKMNYEYGSALLQYPSKKVKYLRNSPIKTVNVPEAYYDFLKDINIDNDDAFSTPYYGQFLDAYTHYLFKKIVMDEEEDFRLMTYFNRRYDFCRTILKGKSLHYMLALNFAVGTQKGKLAKILPKYPDFNKTNEWPEFKQVVDFYYNRYKQLMPGLVAPDFVVKNQAEDVVNLSDYKGKVVYVDFWATWCGPCRKELPHSFKLREQFEGKDVVFLYVSMDKDRSKWEAFVEKQKMDGEQYIALGADKTAINKNYQVSGIPRFILVDKEGRLVDGHADRPSNPLIKEQIEALLAE